MMYMVYGPIVDLLVHIQMYIHVYIRGIIRYIKIMHRLEYLRPYVRRKSDLPVYIGQIYAFYFDSTPYTLNDNVNTKLV